ncbi:alpha/beta fold hydrolase [Arthrobacter sp. CAN_C5]|uniref:alpha/beta fold hydrolase n=1 Tax=Arthrobacter sp. CAN_C5 TaxID=2760706 RepID=UPI001AE9751C|nr:alpha/beta hydrolase [Arthrobacter sp. CAN_C5]MBP2216211.1 3-oxoadipate enol-lactonase [Arthrobacter sp. CAN_C5]
MTPDLSHTMVTSVAFPTALGPVWVRISRSAGVGAAPWVLLHGAAGSWRTFRELQAAHHFPTDVDTVVIDLPGWGDSPGIGGFTIEAQAAAVVEVLVQAGYRQWRLFGHSMGAVPALEIATVEPERTLAVVVLSPTAVVAAQAFRHPWRNLHRMFPLLGMKTIMGFLDLTGVLGPRLVAVARRLRLFRLVLRPFVVRPAALTEPVVTALAVDARPAAFALAADALKHFDFSHWKAAGGIQVLLRGERDVFTPAAELAELAALLPHVQAHVLAGTGHFAHIEDPEAVARILADTSGAADPRVGD